jgi:hypothetical protein
MKIIYTIFALSISLFGISNNEQITTITQIDEIKNEATVNQGNLSKGQSGIVINNNISNKIVIISYATVVSSNKETSTIKFNKQEIIEQDAIPKTKLLPKLGDKFIVNHLYKNGFIIAPNYKALVETKKLYPNFAFLDSDLFGGYLKINNTPAPTKDDIKAFAHKNDLGVVFIVENNTVNIIDAISFDILESSQIKIEDNSTIKPFYTNVEDIKVSTFDFFKAEKIDDYNKYYKNLLGTNDGK